MPRRWVLSLLPVLLLAAGCSSISVSHDWDKDAPYETYRSFDWLPAASTTKSAQTTDAQGALQSSDLLDKRIKSAVDEELTLKGLSKTSNSPDLYVTYHTGVEDKINVTDWGYTYSYDYWGWQDRRMDVYQYEQGTLVVDLIDAKTKELVWRGWATKTLETNPSPDKIQSTIQSAVYKILAEYPPSR
jgi:hypothetical protein